MNKRYKVYYKIFNDKAFMFETDELFGIDLLIKDYLRRFVAIDCFYTDIIVLVYDGDKIIKKERYVFEYSYL